MWGLFPLYWPLLEPANPLEIVSHRAVWTLVFCLIVLALSRQVLTTLTVMKNPKTMAALLLSTILVSINWITYIWAVNHGHVVEAALGYYINPLIIIAFGVLLLREKLRPLQWVVSWYCGCWSSRSYNRLRQTPLGRNFARTFMG